jgi:hypothetical protein
MDITSFFQHVGDFFTSVKTSAYQTVFGRPIEVEHYHWEFLLDLVAPCSMGEYLSIEETSKEEIESKLKTLEFAKLEAIEYKAILQQKLAASPLPDPMKNKLRTANMLHRYKATLKILEMEKKRLTVSLKSFERPSRFPFRKPTSSVVPVNTQIATTVDVIEQQLGLEKPQLEISLNQPQVADEQEAVELPVNVQTLLDQENASVNAHLAPAQILNEAETSVSISVMVEEQENVEALSSFQEETFPNQSVLVDEEQDFEKGQGLEVEQDLEESNKLVPISKIPTEVSERSAKPCFNPLLRAAIEAKAFTLKSAPGLEPNRYAIRNVILQTIVQKRSSIEDDEDDEDADKLDLTFDNEAGTWGEKTSTWGGPTAKMGSNTQQQPDSTTNATQALSNTANFIQRVVNEQFAQPLVSVSLPKHEGTGDDEDWETC